MEEAEETEKTVYLTPPRCCAPLCNNASRPEYRCEGCCEEIYCSRECKKRRKKLHVKKCTELKNISAKFDAKITDFTMPELREYLRMNFLKEELCEYLRSHIDDIVTTIASLEPMTESSRLCVFCEAATNSISVVSVALFRDESTESAEFGEFGEPEKEKEKIDTPKTQATITLRYASSGPCAGLGKQFLMRSNESGQLWRIFDCPSEFSLIIFFSKKPRDGAHFRKLDLGKIVLDEAGLSVHIQQSRMRDLWPQTSEKKKQALAFVLIKEASDFEQLLFDARCSEALFAITEIEPVCVESFSFKNRRASEKVLHEIACELEMQRVLHEIEFEMGADPALNEKCRPEPIRILYTVGESGMAYIGMFYTMFMTQEKSGEFQKIMQVQMVVFDKCYMTKGLTALVGRLVDIARIYKCVVIRTHAVSLPILGLLNSMGFVLNTNPDKRDCLKFALDARDKGISTGELMAMLRDYGTKMPKRKRRDIVFRPHIGFDMYKLVE